MILVIKNFDRGLWGFCFSFEEPNWLLLLSFFQRQNMSFCKSCTISRSLREMQQRYDISLWALGMILLIYPIKKSYNKEGTYERYLMKLSPIKLCNMLNTNQQHLRSSFLLNVFVKCELHKYLAGVCTWSNQVVIGKKWKHTKSFAILFL